MYYVYVLISLKDGNLYTGFARDLPSRISKHNYGEVGATKGRRPLKLIYYEMCLSKKDTLHRERYLKTSWGKKYIKNRLRSYLKNATMK